MSASTITPRQQAFVKNLLDERKDVLGIENVDEYITAQGIATLTGQGASKLIEALLAIKVGAKPEHKHLPEGRVIVNKFAKACSFCNTSVSAGEGFAVQTGAGWRTYHKDGECTGVVDVVQTLDRGYYALPSATGNNDLDFFVVHVNEGHQRICRVIGGHPNQPLNVGQSKAVAERLHALTPAERLQAQALYGQALGYCGRCGRHLTDEASRARGLGSECASKA